MKKKILEIIKKKTFLLYKIIIVTSGLLKFLNKINQRKKYKNFSSNLDNINKKEYRITSQNNEDGIINFIFSELQLDKLNFVEIGFDFYQNNSLSLLKKSKKGLFIDGDEKKVLILKNIVKILYPRKNLIIQNHLVDVDSINNLIKQNFEASDEVDFLSIDVDGMDYYLFESIDFSPKLICIEYNFWFGKNLKCVAPYKKNYKVESLSEYVGSSLRALIELAKLKGYHLIALESNCVNAFFIRDDLKDKFDILDIDKSFKEPAKFNKQVINEVQKKLIAKELFYLDEKTE